MKNGYFHQYFVNYRILENFYIIGHTVVQNQPIQQIIIDQPRIDQPIQQIVHNQSIQQIIQNQPVQNQPVQHLKVLLTF